MNVGLNIVLIVLYVLPITGGILFLHWILKRYGYEKLANALRKYLFLLLVAGFMTVNIVDWNLSHHSSKVQLNGKYEVDLEMHEIESFLDWPIAFEIKVLDIKENKQVELEFESDGPYYQFLINKEGKIWIMGYDRNAGDSWVIDVRNENIFEGEPSNTDKFTLQAQIKSNFEIEKK